MPTSDFDQLQSAFSSGGADAALAQASKLLREQKMDDVRVVVGGIIPAQDIPELKRMGVANVFLPGSSLEEVVRSVGAA